MFFFNISTHFLLKLVLILILCFVWVKIPPSTFWGYLGYGITSAMIIVGIVLAVKAELDMTNDDYWETKEYFQLTLALSAILLTVVTLLKELF